jgi:hypothetical protein
MGETMSILTRVINIATKPKEEWPIIDSEPATVQSIMTGFVIPLALIPQVCGFLNGVIFTSAISSMTGVHVSTNLLFFSAVLGYVLTLAGVLITAFIAYKLAPSFQSVGDLTQALKVVAYAQGPYWLAGILGLFPVLGIFAIFVGLYGLYLAYLGLPVVMKTPPDKALPYLVVIIIVGLIVSIIIGLITAGIAGVGIFATGGL